LPPKLAPWTANDEATHVRILGAARAQGITQADLARAAGVHQVQLSRWVSKISRLTPAQLARMAARVEGRLAGVADAADPPQEQRHSAVPPPAADGGAVAGATMRQAIRFLEDLAGPDDGEEGAVPKDLRSKLSRRHARAAIGTLVRTMIAGKTETARVRAAEAILEFGFGKATQSTLDLTPKPPATDAELLAILAKLAGEPAAGGRTIEAGLVDPLVDPTKIDPAALEAAIGERHGGEEAGGEEGDPQPDGGSEDRMDAPGRPDVGEAKPEGAQ
jgi:transcriptional regulator with XRE-family HTH domain